MLVVKVSPFVKEPELMDVDPDKIYDIVPPDGGYIERVFPFDDPVAVLCDEEGKLKGLPINRHIRYKNGYKDFFVGTILIVGIDRNFEEISLDKDLADKYVDMFRSANISVGSSPKEEGEYINDHVSMQK